jgi:hypothetical protein
MQHIPIFQSLVWPDRGSNPRSTALEIVSKQLPTYGIYYGKKELWIVDTIVGTLLFPEGILHPVVSVLELTWFIRYIQCILFTVVLNNLINTKPKILLPRLRSHYMILAILLFYWSQMPFIQICIPNYFTTKVHNEGYPKKIIMRGLPYIRYICSLRTQKRR